MSLLDPLFTLAAKARDNAYCPHSTHQVGAAILTTSGKTYAGCNVENSSYGATLCAERVAIGNAISEEGRIQISEIVIVTNASPPWPPCGMCRQMIAEFAAPNLLVHTLNLKKEKLTFKFSELFPHAFTPKFLGHE